MILSLTNVKGGVGKTTTAVNLAAAFGRSDLRVLLIDLDPQGSATISTGMDPDGVEPSVAGVLLEGTPVSEAIHTSEVAGVDVLGSSMDLAGADLSLARRRNPERLLATALAPVRRRYDFIFIDCPPGLGILTLNGMAASHAYIVPTVPHDLDRIALGHLFDGLEHLRGRVRRWPHLLGILLTMVDRRTRVTSEVVREIRSGYGRDVFRTEIPINVRLAEAPGYGHTIFEYESWSPGAQAYSRLGAEAIARARKAGLI